MTAEEILHTGNPLQQGNISKQIQIDRPLKGKLRIMPI